MTAVNSYILHNDPCFWETNKRLKTHSEKGLHCRPVLPSVWTLAHAPLLWISINLKKKKNRAGAQATDTKIPTKTKISLWQKCLLLGKSAASCFASPLTERCCCLVSGLASMRRFDLFGFVLGKSHRRSNSTISLSLFMSCDVQVCVSTSVSSFSSRGDSAVLKNQTANSKELWPCLHSGFTSFKVWFLKVPLP